MNANGNGRSHAALVVGAGIAGIQAALDIADAGFKVYLVEKSPSIGGRMSQLDKTFPTLDCSSCILTPKMADVPRNPNIELLTCTQVKAVDGGAGGFHAGSSTSDPMATADHATKIHGAPDHGAGHGPRPAAASARASPAPWIPWGSGHHRSIRYPDSPQPTRFDTRPFRYP